MRFPDRVVALAAGLAFVAMGVLAAGPASTSNWDLGALAAGKTYPTSISISNASCPGIHTLELSREQLDWVEIVGSPVISELPAGQAREVKLVVDLRNREPGTYTGNLKVRCTTCPRTCSQDVGTFKVMVKVVKGEKTQRPAAVDPMPDVHASLPQIDLASIERAEAGRGREAVKAFCQDLETHTADPAPASTARSYSAPTETKPGISALRPLCGTPDKPQEMQKYTCASSTSNIHGYCADSWWEAVWDGQSYCVDLKAFCQGLGGKWTATAAEF